jgi:hypothetical protein
LLTANPTSLRGILARRSGYNIDAKQCQKQDLKTSQNNLGWWHKYVCGALQTMQNPTDIIFRCVYISISIYIHIGCA